MDVASLTDYGLALLRNQKIGFVFQQFHMLPKTSVLGNILLPTKYPCERKRHDVNSVDRAKQLAEVFGLTNEINKMPNQLSGGQQQRVAIARALINDADIILADEPTGNLDSENARHVIDLLMELNQQGKTVVLITHDREIAKRFSKVYEMRDGEIKTESSPIIHNDRSKTAYLNESSNSFLLTLRRLIPLALENMGRHRVRSVLTMMGISIGVAAVLATTTLGKSRKERMLSSFAELGVNTINFPAYPNFNLTATDDVPVMFRSLDNEKDIKPLKRIFPHIKRTAPQTQPSWSNTIIHGGKSIPDVFVTGISEIFAIMNLAA